MRQVEISYDDLEKEMVTELKKLGSEGLYKRGILATSLNDKVTARRMRFIPDGLKLYCWTARLSRKYKQINTNPNVAVVAGFIQIEGTATTKGHPMDEPKFLELYRKQLPMEYENSIKDWRDFDQVVIEITPNRLAVYKFPGDESGVTEYGLDILNVSNRTAHRMIGIKHEYEDYRDAPAYVA